MSACLQQEKDRTMILISHRLYSFDEKADRICYIENGKIVEEGTHEDLMSKWKICVNVPATGEFV